MCASKSLLQAISSQWVKRLDFEDHKFFEQKVARGSAQSCPAVIATRAANWLSDTSSDSLRSCATRTSQGPAAKDDVQQQNTAPRWYQVDHSSASHGALPLAVDPERISFNRPSRRVLAYHPRLRVFDLASDFDFGAQSCPVIATRAANWLSDTSSEVVCDTRTTNFSGERGYIAADLQHRTRWYQGLILLSVTHGAFSLAVDHLVVPAIARPLIPHSNTADRCVC
jgi:hypothetical protein